MRLLLAGILFVAAGAAHAGGPTILVIGDSISAAHGIPVADGWVARLRQRLAATGYRYRVVNASVGGDTTSGGRARLPRALEAHEPALVIIELGGNDGLRGQPPAAMAANLEAMVGMAREAGARVLLLGVRLPPNYGPAYNEAFARAFRQAADNTGAPLVPRLLEGVGERRELMQGDGIHPNPAGHARILANVWPALESLLGEPAAAGGQTIPEESRRRPVQAGPFGS
jgi:acyl-CoA thioesterase-1